jgi:hypothetical protein
MTPRPLARMRRAAWLLAAVGLLTLAGCDPRSIFYFLQPFEPTIAPPGPALKGKRVVILTHAVSGTQADFPALDRDLARGLAAILRQKVKKIDLVDIEKVRSWVDAHPSYSDPAEAGRAFDADAVIFLEVESFQIQNPSSPGLFEGTSKVHIQVHQLRVPTDSDGREIAGRPRESEVVYDDVRDTTFPVRGPIPMDVGVSRSAFRKKFLDLVVTEVSWHFVDHAPGDNIQDVKFDQ